MAVDSVFMEDIRARASRLGINLSEVDWDSIHLPPGQDFGIKSDDEDLYEEDSLEFEGGFGNIIVVDNLPVVPKEKFEKLEGVVRKIYSQIGVIKEDGLWMPVDPASQKTLGYCFIEYNTPQEAELAKEKTNGYKLDRAHIFAVNMFDEIEKFMKVPNEWAPPETKPFSIGPTHDEKWQTISKVCAASMNVCVGSLSVPKGLEGLAHFLEHMFFYASEKYPLEDSYSKYITEHGGSTNAFTSSEQTNFYFDVNADCFEEALDRFAQFFIKPLMSSDATMREIKAVDSDSENQKKLLSDAWRMHQLQKHLSAEDHPYHKFSTGNWDTLEVRPQLKGVDTRQELLKFYEQNYLSNLIPTDLTLKTAPEKANLPLSMRVSPYSRLWYKSDSTFFTHKAHVKIDFNCPFAGNSPETEVLTDIFTRLVTDYLNEYAYYAQVAGLYYAVNHTDNGFQVIIGDLACCVTALFEKNELIVSNIGNWRAVFCRVGTAEIITKDHRVSQVGTQEGSYIKYIQTFDPGGFI